MKAISDRLLKKLQIQDAVTAEAQSTRNLVPEEPGWSRLGTQAASLSGYIESVLRYGFVPSLQQETLARKPGLGVRPVAYWGPIERVVYRALSEVALGPLEKPDRSSKAYVKFMHAPVDRAFELDKAENTDAPRASRTLLMFSMDVPLKYIVKADVSAFYQFVDHDLLQEELVSQGGDAEAVARLGDLLREVEGRGFGLPQLLEPSDWLSEVAIDRVERQVHRAGIETWRFNDDFRLGCSSYEDSLKSIEILDAAARANGFVLNEPKTLTYRFLSYMIESYDASEETSTEVIAADDVETLVGDYTDSFENDADQAVELLGAAQPDAQPPHINLRKARVAEARLLTRALNGLAKAVDARSVDRASQLLTFVPSLTPAICRYLTVCHPKDPAGVAQALDSIRQVLSLSEWQRVWVVDTYRRLELLESPTVSPEAAPRAVWASEQRRGGRTAALRATATRALAHAGRLSVSEVVAGEALEPDCMVMHYADATLGAAIHSTAAQDSKALKAFANESKLHTIACTEVAVTAAAPGAAASNDGDPSGESDSEPSDGGESRADSQTPEP